MTLDRLNNLLHFANIIGIKTVGDLMKFKKETRSLNNKQLYMQLYYAALHITKNVSA